MFKLSILFKKTVLVASIAALVLAAFPLTNAYATELNVPTDPPEDTEQSTERLENIWARLQRAYERQGQILERADTMAEKIQGLIDRMEENGKDVTALQAALDAFAASLAEVDPIYQGAGDIVDAHEGFDAEGKVTDRELAIETAKELGMKMKEMREIAGEPGKALREAIKTYREAHRPKGASDSNS